MIVTAFSPPQRARRESTPGGWKRLGDVVGEITIMTSAGMSAGVRAPNAYEAAASVPRIAAIISRS